MARYAATPSFGTAVPGGGWFGRGPDSPSAYPYAVHTIEADAQKTMTNNAYVQKFTVKVAVYTLVGVAPATSPQTVALALVSALCITAAQTAFQAASLRNGTEHVLHARQVTPKGEFADKLREGRDVFVCGLSVELLCQGNAAVA